MSTRTADRGRPSRPGKAAARAAAEQLARRRRRQTILGAGAAVVVVAAAGIALSVSHDSRGAGRPSAPPGPVSIGHPDAAAATLPPWSAPPDVPAQVQAAGLDLGPMGTADHYHVHLDVLVNGTAVPIAANIGVDPGSGAMSGLHTHDASGIIHIEAARKNEPFTLGQLFTEWDVKLTPTQLGALTAAGPDLLRVFVNGQQASGDPAAIVLHAHQEIALVYGPATAKIDVPRGFDFHGI